MFVVAAVILSFKFHRKFYCMFYCSCDPSINGIVDSNSVADAAVGRPDTLRR